MTTAAGFVLDVERMLTSGSREESNQLNADMDTTTTSVVLADPLNSVQQGAWISVDLEDMYVRSVNGQTATVRRGQYGTSPAAHTSGTVVYVKPHASKYAILQALNEDLAAMSSAGLYHMANVEVTFNPSKAGYDLNGVTSLQDVYMLQTRHTGVIGDWRSVDPSGYRVTRDADTGDFPSGYSLRLTSGGQAGQVVRVHYKQPFVAFTDLTTNVTATLLAASMYDIPKIGAAWRLVSTREVGRNDTSTQGDTKRATEVPPRAVAASAADLLARWNLRVAQELNDLQRRYPIVAYTGLVR